MTTELLVGDLLGNVFTFPKYKSAVLDDDSAILTVMDKDDNIIYFNFSMVVYMSEKIEKEGMKK